MTEHEKMIEALIADLVADYGDFARVQSIAICLREFPEAMFQQVIANEIRGLEHPLAPILRAAAEAHAERENPAFAATNISLRGYFNSETGLTQVAKASLSDSGSWLGHWDGGNITPNESRGDAMEGTDYLAECDNWEATSDWVDVESAPRSRTYARPGMMMPALVEIVDGVWVGRFGCSSVNKHGYPQRAMAAVHEDALQGGWTPVGEWRIDLGDGPGWQKPDPKPEGIKRGDVVRLKSGSPRLVVGRSTGQPGVVVVTCWGNGEFLSTEVHLSGLVAAEAAPPSAETEADRVR